MFEFSEGKSYYAARSIASQSHAPLALKFKTFLSTQFLPKADVVVPYFVFLDESKRPLLTAKPDRLARGNDFWRGVYFEAVVPIPTAARHFIIFASNTDTPRLHSVSANGTVRVVPHSPSGTVDVEVLRTDLAP